MRRLKYITIFILLLVLSCKTKTDIVNPDTELIVTTTVKGATTNGVKVYLFDSQSAYQSGSSNSAAAYKFAVDSGTSVNGTVTFHNLSTSINYWLYVIYADPGGSKYHYNNLNSYNYVYNTLASGSQTYATVDLEVTQTFVGFWSSDSTHLPINILIGGDTLTLTSYSATTPDPILGSAFYKKANQQPGTYPYYAYNADRSFIIQDM